MTTIAAIQQATAKYFGCTVNDLTANRLAHARARHVAMYLCREMTGKSFPTIGRAFGDRDHSTVIYACRKVEMELAKGNQL